MTKPKPSKVSLRFRFLQKLLNKLKGASLILRSLARRLAVFRPGKRFVRIVLLSLLVITPFCLVFFKDLPNPRRLTGNYPESTLISDQTGKTLYEFYSEKNRQTATLTDISPNLINATLAIEDHAFYRHWGFDLKGLIRASWKTIFKGKLQGGSTITQQLVKNALLTQERTIKRKLKEAVLTLATELLYSKDHILEMYFNQTPYGGTAWGAETAAQTYFGKQAKDLSLAEAALLAGLPAAPSAYSPFSHPDRAKARQELVLARMVETKMISQDEAEKAKETKLIYQDPGISIQAPHFVFYIREYLVDKYGERTVDEGGLNVTTTLDLALQTKLELMLATEAASLSRFRVSNGAILVTEPKTGKIRAMIGSKDYFAEDIDGKFNVTTALRQPGSAIKPINYAIGIDRGKFTAATIFNDMPTCFTGGPKRYCPDNYDNLFHGPVALRYALGNSFNIPAVKALYLNGVEDFVASASAMGLSTFTDPTRYGLSLTLGGGEVKMTDMAVAFGTLANGGLRQNLTGIEKVTDRNGQVLEDYQHIPGERVLSMEASWIIHHILSDDGARSAVFGSHSQLYVKNHPEVAVKTGTTNDKRDNWTIGFSPSMVTTVWVGNNDNSPMSAVASGTTGASSIFAKAMLLVLENKQTDLPPRPAKVVGKNVCNQTGALPPPEGCETRYEYFLDRFGPPPPTALRRDILIDKDTGAPVQPGENKPNAEWQNHLATLDLLGTVLCLDCTVTASPSAVTIH